jgi:hypothetical protein
MKKEEFPTFLNEQPTVIFGRTTRELLILAIGLAGGYLIWLDISGPGIAMIILKWGVAMLPLILALFVAFMKVATRPLEEWAVIGFSYLVLPKVYLYFPGVEDTQSERDQVEQDNLFDDRPVSEDDDDRYN